VESFGWSLKTGHCKDFPQDKTWIVEVSGTPIMSQPIIRPSGPCRDNKSLKPSHVC